MRYDEQDNPNVLLAVEDNPADARLLHEVFREIRARVTFALVTDGEQAMAYLRQSGDFAGAPRPDLILLDLRLPRKDGREVLAEVKADHELRTIPVIVLTSSMAEDDVRGCYALGANSYVTKPVAYDEFERKIRSLADFWLTVAMLPGG